jgi:hypothetical protein
VRAPLTTVTGASSSTTSVATCPAGTFLVGGGANLGGGTLVSSYPSTPGVGGSWTAIKDGSGNVQAFAYCQAVA